jgi:N-acetylglucosamine kinase-like BadF-type ATPase
MMAGAGRQDVHSLAVADIEKMAPEFFPHTDWYLFHDGQSAVWAAEGNGVGVVVSAGTGSIAYGMDAEGKVVRCGGWGRIAGDEGSAYWIVVRTVSRILRAFDGRAPDTKLNLALLKTLGLSSPDQLVEWVQRGGKKAIASVAAAVDKTAQAGDRTAAQILAEAGEELADMAWTVAKQLDLDSPATVHITGSVLRESSTVRQKFSEELKKLIPGVTVETCRFTPVTGAALLLVDRVKKGWRPDIPGERAQL